jgi:hypothetical protein
MLENTPFWNRYALIRSLPVTLLAGTTTPFGSVHIPLEAVQPRVPNWLELNAITELLFANGMKEAGLLVAAAI